MTSQFAIDQVVRRLAGDVVLTEFNERRYARLAEDDGEPDNYAAAEEWAAKHEQALRAFLRCYPELCASPKKEYLKAIERFASQVTSAFPSERWYLSILEAMRTGDDEHRESWELALADNQKTDLA